MLLGKDSPRDGSDGDLESFPEADTSPLASSAALYLSLVLSPCFLPLLTGPVDVVCIPSPCLFSLESLSCHCLCEVPTQRFV